MRSLQTLVALTALFLGGGNVIAGPPDAGEIIDRVGLALEPSRPSLRKITLAVTQEGSRVEVQLGEARGKVDGAKRVLVVVLAPDDVRGTAFLVQEQPSGPNDTTWLYIPAIGRVRRLVAPEAFSAFLNSDFTYADLGFVGTHATLKLQAEKTVGGDPVYVIRMGPTASWYYSAIEIDVDARSHLPLERRFFDPAGVLWKVERWSKVTTINGTPTALEIGMEDVQAKTSSTLTVMGTRYDVDGLEPLLQSSRLPEAAASPLWGSLDDLASEEAGK